MKEKNQHKNSEIATINDAVHLDRAISTLEDWRNKNEEKQAPYVRGTDKQKQREDKKKLIIIIIAS
jgi:hypothetical protein